MKSPEWNQKVILVSQDPEIIQKITPVFSKETIFITASSSQEAIARLDEGKASVVILDTETTDPDLHYFEKKECISYKELVQYAMQVNNGVTTVLLTNKMLIKDGDFSRKSGCSLIMDRKNISVSRLVFIIRVLRKRTFRTLLLRDLSAGIALPVDLFHFLPANNRFAQVALAGSTLTADRLEKLAHSRSYHLYVREEEFPQAINAIRGQNTEHSFSEGLAIARGLYTNMLRTIFDISTDANITTGKALLDDGAAIVLRLEEMIARFPNPLECITELLFPRWSAIAHGINCATLSLLFARQCGLDSPGEIAWAALFHNLGLADIPQELLQQSELTLSHEDLVRYHQHALKSVDLLKVKQIPTSARIEKAILFHHENYDGTGFPEARAGVNLPMEAALLAIVGAFDHLVARRPRALAHSPQEAWQDLLRIHTSSTILKKKFHPELLKKLEPLFTNS